MAQSAWPRVELSYRGKTRKLAAQPRQLSLFCDHADALWRYGFPRPLNNVAYAALFENGRVRFNRSLDERSLRGKGERWLVAAVEINYLREGHFPYDVQILAGLAHQAG